MAVPRPRGFPASALARHIRSTATVAGEPMPDGFGTEQTFPDEILTLVNTTRLLHSAMNTSTQNHRKVRSSLVRVRPHSIPAGQAMSSGSARRCHGVGQS